MKWEDNHKGPDGNNREKTYQNRESEKVAGHQAVNTAQTVKKRSAPVDAGKMAVAPGVGQTPRFWERVVEDPSAFIRLQGAWCVLRVLAISLSALLLVMAGVLLVWQYADNKYFLPVNGEDHTPVQVTIKRGTSISSISSDLEDMQLVRSASMYKMYVDLSGSAGKMKAGTYWLDKSMTYQQITEKIVQGNGGQQVQTFLLREGLTIEQMAQSLVDQGIISSPDRFLELCRTGEAFAAKYDFINQLLQEDHSDRKYQLEGYLFPAKYEVYVGSSEEEIIEKMLDKTKTVMNEDFLKRAQEQNMSVDDVITLASMIEKEATTKDFYKVSAVFYNRLAIKDLLRSDATVKYVTGKKTLKLTSEDIAIDSPYNTYKYAGLPTGPIANPGLEAIKAALYPDETYIAQKYLYFTTKDPLSGELEFNKTLDAHNAAVAKYEPLWKAYDEQHAAENSTTP